MGLVAALICLPSAAQSQEPIRAKLMAAPRPGRPALRIDWAALARRADSLKSPRIVLVGVGRAGMSEVQGLSGSLGGSLKVLADSGGWVHRQFGVSDRDLGWTIVVVADDGTLVALERFATLTDGKWWLAVAGAIAR